MEKKKRMFVGSVRMTTLQFCAVLLGGVLLTAAVVLFLPPGIAAPASAGSPDPAGETARLPQASARRDGMKSDEDLASFLEALGWHAKVPPVFDRTVIFPERFGQSFAAYAALQRAQGFDPDALAGKEVRKVTFELRESEETAQGGQAPLLATLFVYRETIVGGDVSSSDPGGSVRPLTGDPPAESAGAD